MCARGGARAAGARETPAPPYALLHVLRVVVHIHLPPVELVKALPHDAQSLAEAAVVAEGEGGKGEADGGGAAEAQLRRKCREGRGGSREGGIGEVGRWERASSGL